MAAGGGAWLVGAATHHQCCVAVCGLDRWLESATCRVGFRALKKTLEAPYTTKVNNRVHTTAWNNPITRFVKPAPRALAQAARASPVSCHPISY